MYICKIMVWSRNMYGDTLERRHKTLQHRVACEGRDITFISDRYYAEKHLKFGDCFAKKYNLLAQKEKK